MTHFIWVGRYSHSGGDLRVTSSVIHFLLVKRTNALATNDKPRITIKPAQNTNQSLLLVELFRYVVTRYPAPNQ